MDEVIMLSDERPSTQRLTTGTAVKKKRRRSSSPPKVKPRVARRDWTTTISRIPATHTLLDFAEVCGVPNR